MWQIASREDKTIVEINDYFFLIALDTREELKALTV